MYWGAVVLVVSALRQGRTEGFTMRRLQDLFGVTGPTLVRWLRYFREIFPQSRAWRWVRARLCPAIAPGDLAGMIARFVGARDDPEVGLVTCLKVLCTAPR